MPSVARTAAACLIVLLAPALAWLAWVSWGEGKTSDAGHVAWFATVALGVVVAGAVGRPGRLQLVVLTLLALAATITGLFLWWSAQDDSGLFLVGILFATPLLAASAPLLLVLGRALSRTASDRNRA